MLNQDVLYRNSIGIHSLVQPMTEMKYNGGLLSLPA